jgi:hypothetical protein
MTNNPDEGLGCLTPLLLRKPLKRVREYGIVNFNKQEIGKNDLTNIIRKDEHRLSPQA